jgi:hypothetical protein
LVDFSTLPSDIHGILEGRAVSDPSVLKTFGPEIGAVLEKKFSDDVKTPSLRMSNLGKPMRQLWYELNNYPAEALSGQTHFKFLYGHVIEALVICLAKASGHIIEREQEEVSVDGIVGHIDGFCDGVLFDVKSCSPYSFTKFETGSLLEPGNDVFGYIGQLSSYASALKQDEATYVAVNKVLGSICTLTLPQKQINEYDVRRRISEVRSSISSKDAPERCYSDEPDGKSGNRKLSIGCSYCGFKQTCWSDSNGGAGLKAYTYSTGVRFLTEVVREPKVNESNWEAFPVKHAEQSAKDKKESSI